MDSIGDMLTRIRNAKMVRHETVSFPYSKIKMAVLKILKAEHFIEDFEKKGKKIRKSIAVTLKYDKDGASKISGLRRISKPGRKIYKKASELYPVRQGFGIMVVSTPQGLLTGKEARKRNVGGEVLCEVW